MLDAGCGTGKCGPLLKPFADHLWGVDLSPKMTAKAEQLGIYQTLVVGELTAFIAARPKQFDVIVAADTLNYFGDLQPVLMAARAAVKDPGYLLFTLEKSGESQSTGYRLNPNGRYSHSQSYLDEQLSSAGWEVSTSRVAVLRKEADQPVLGLLVAAKAIQNEKSYTRSDH